ncbi:hypothetical protein K7X08_008477 [Anisodus acutangulus]|uniref:Uncharacterized protein n=1 Tax=Anisodus acutangulus TaxID=402998 RepID=A0A9Q1MRC4_9SOLA|nr:hypothetical protein K7X08_008477 [Anisodus acutangulus]
MDEIGVHSLMNAKKSIVPDVGTTSPVQTIAGKDKSNPLTAVTLAKSEAEEVNSSKTRRNLPQTFTGTTSKARSRPIKKGQTKNIEQIIKETLEKIFKEQMDAKSEDKHENPVATPPTASLTTEQNPENNQNLDNIDHVSETSSDNEFLESNYAQDPNENYDSGMSFDSVALHNLDT